MNIEAKDLRIGNLLKRPTQPDGFLVDAETISRLYHSGIRDEEPIKLTEELLVKFGFYKYNDEEFYINDEKRSTDLLRLFKNIDGFNIGHYPCKLQYVHQLQNLHFAITGEELPITILFTNLKTKRR